MPNLQYINANFCFLPIRCNLCVPLCDFREVSPNDFTDYMGRGRGLLRPPKVITYYMDDPLRHFGPPGEDKIRKIRSKRTQFRILYVPRVNAASLRSPRLPARSTSPGKYSLMREVQNSELSARVPYFKHRSSPWRGFCPHPPPAVQYVLFLQDQWKAVLPLGRIDACKSYIVLGTYQMTREVWQKAKLVTGFFLCTLP